MRFDLRRPCPKCPFRKDCLPEWLGERRAEEIAESLLGRPGATFPCHETTQHDDEGDHVQREDEQHCAGALLLVEADGAPNQMLQIAERLGIRDPDLLDPDAAALVFPDREAFVKHHTTERERS